MIKNIQTHYKKMGKKLPRICFIGCGNIAAKHVSILKKLYPGIEIYFASSDGIKSKAFSKKYKGKGFFNSYNEAFESNLFDIAFITTPHAHHSELAVKAANNRKDIIIEKPIARSIKEINKIEKAAAKNNVRCTVAENYYYKPIIKKLRAIIKDGQIGDVLFIEINKTNKDSISGWRADKEMMGGGALLEGGVHWVNALVMLADAAPVGVIAFKPDVKYETNVPFEDTLMINVSFDNGIIGKLLHSWFIKNPLKGIGISKIYGTEGIITFESNGLFYRLHGKKKKTCLINPFDFLGFKAMHKAFIENYIKSVPWEPSLESIKKQFQIVEKAYKSLKTRKIEDIL
ncbi:MAG: Gfo/Idh/MocA family oxidoreductase [Spirochaetes bacterium]|nr:Gfo/Idh/MocA family oxidoreductase [Spirochaetota bacterium]